MSKGSSCAEKPPRGSMSLRGWSVALCFALAACSVGPEYARPDAPLPVAFRESQAAEASWPSADWWRAFGSAELDAYIGEARRANTDLSAAVARVSEADALAKAAGAALLPAVSAGGGAVHERVLSTSGAYQNAKLYNAQIAA